MKTVFTFPDGDQICWTDRESFAYVNGDRQTQVWVDYEPGFFRAGRIIRKESLINWSELESGRIAGRISEEEAQIIVGRLMEYFKAIRKKARIDLSPLPVEIPR